MVALRNQSLAPIYTEPLDSKFLHLPSQMLHMPSCPQSKIAAARVPHMPPKMRIFAGTNFRIEESVSGAGSPLALGLKPLN